MAAERLHVKKGDRVLILAGKDKGKEGKVIGAQPKKGKVIVEGINKVKRHTKPSQTSQGGIVVKEAAIASSNVMLVCPACKKAARIKKNQLSDGKYVRACVKCGESIDK